MKKLGFGKLPLNSNIVFMVVVEMNDNHSAATNFEMAFGKKVSKDFRTVTRILTPGASK